MIDRAAPWAAAAVVIGLFAEIIAHPFVVYDDVVDILHNPVVAAPETVSLIDRLLTTSLGYIIPLSGWVWSLLFTVGGGAAWPFHVLGLALHALIVWMVVRWAISWGAPARLATLCALVFACHPLVVEPVAWATGLKDMLCAALLIGGTWAFSHAALGRAPGRRTFWLAALLACAAPLAKPIAVLVGFAWFGWLALRRRAGESVSRGAWLTAAATATWGAATAVGSRLVYDSFLVEGVDEGRWHAFLALGYHLHHLALPTDLHPFYRIDRTAGFDDPHTWIGAVGVLGLGLGGGWLVRKGAPVALPLVVALSVYLPVSNLLPFPRFLADSYAYIPLALAAVAGAVGLTPLWERSRFGARTTGAVLLVVAVALSVLTVDQVARWRGREALWRPLIEAEPDWSVPKFVLAHAEFSLGHDPASAARWFRAGFAQGYDPDALGNFAISLARLGALDRAECVFVEALHNGPDPQVAADNYAVFLATNPSHAARYRREAASTVRDALGRPGRWTPDLDNALRARLATLPTADEPSIWAPDSCQDLRREPGASVPQGRGSPGGP